MERRSFLTSAPLGMTALALPSLALAAEPTRHIFKSDCDWYSAESLEHAIALRECPDDDLNDPFHDEPMSDDEILKLWLTDGWQDEHGESRYPRWADHEPGVKVEWVNYGNHPVAVVHAPAGTWARYVEGVVGSTNN